MMSRRRGDSDDEGAAPPAVNHRYGSGVGMGGSSASHYSVNSNEGSNPHRSSMPISWMSPPDRQQLSASTHGVLSSASHHASTGPNHHSSSMNNQGSPNSSSDMAIVRASSSSSRYLAKSTKLPSRWVLDAQDRALMSVTSLDRTRLRLNHGPAGDPSHVTALPSTPSTPASCVVVSNHSIPLDYLKEVALKNGGDHPHGGLLGEDSLAESSGTTIDQILSNLRSKPFTASTSTTNRRASSASLYPSLPGESRGGGGGGAAGSSSLAGGSSHHDGGKRFRSGTASSGGNSKATNSPVYYFEVTIQSLPLDAVVSVGMVVTDGPAAATDDKALPAIPGDIKQSIGLTSRGELKVSGRVMEEKKFAQEEFQVGDVIGCGLEVVGTRRLFFTRNGKTVIPPTRFQDVEPKYSDYSPSVGILMGGTSNSGVSMYANFGAKSGRAFQWEESEFSHIVNSSSVSQMDQKKPPPPAASSGGDMGKSASARMNGDSTMAGGSASQSGSPLLERTEYLEQRSAPLSQMYNFGKPSSRNEGLMASLENMPLPGDDDADNDDMKGSSNYSMGMPNGHHKGPQQHQTPLGRAQGGQSNQASTEMSALASKGTLSASATSKASPPQAVQSEDLKVKRAPSGKSPARSKSPRGLFSFGRSSKKSSQGASTPDSSSSQRKASSRSSSPALFGAKSKKKGGGLLDEDEDENDLGQLESDFQKIALAVQEMPSSQRQTPADSANFNGPRTAVGIPSTSGAGAPMLFGKKSKKSSLDDDNPSDVQLQTAISNDFPIEMARVPSGTNGAANVSAMAAATGIAPAAAKNGPDSGTPVMFGKKSKQGTLEDDDVEDHVQSNFATLPTNDFDPTSGLASLPNSGVQIPVSDPVVFRSKSKNNSLEDDDPDDIQYQTHAQMTFGSKSKKKSLEDDDPDDDKYESHSSLTGFNLGAPNKKNSLEDDIADDDIHVNHASLNPGTAGKPSSAGGMGPNGSHYPPATLPNPTPMGGHRRDSNSTSSQNTPYGSKSDDDAPDGFPGFRSSFGAPSKKGSLEDDDPNDSSYQSHSHMFGSSSSKQASFENDDPKAERYPSTTQSQERAAGLPSINPYMPRGSITPGNPARGSPQRHRQNMMRSAPIGASTANANMPSALDTPVSASLASGGMAAHASTNNADPNQLPDSHSPNRNRPSTIEPASSSSSAHAPEGASEIDMLNAAIEESKRDHKKQELNRQISVDGGALKDPKEIEIIRGNTRDLRLSCQDEGVDASVLESLLEICREDQAKIQACLQSEDPPVDFMEMLALNELVVDAIKMGQKMVEGSKKKAPPSSAVSVTSKSSKTNLNLDIGALVEKKDIFSLICILRAQSDQRLDAALALMNFAREADSLAEAGTRSLRDEIRSSGGMHSLITVFRSKGASYELRVVSALAVAYVLPSFVESSSVHPSVGLKIMECLRFLSTSRLVSPNGRRISQEEMYRASAAGVTTFWINELTPMLNSGAGAPKNDSTAERSDLFSRTNKKGRRRGRTGGQRHQTLELQELLEMTVSLIVQIERLGENEVLKKNQSAQTDSLFLWRYTNVEQVCAVDVARPIAVREGLLPILVGWIRSGDREKVRPAVSALRYLTSIKDKYMAGWIHSQMVNEGALAEVVKLADDYYVGQDVRLAVAQILASLCVAPHTRAAVVEAKCINYLIGFLYDHSDKASQDVALFAGSAILQLAEGAITRASVLGGGDTELQDGASPDKSDTLVE